MYPIPQSSVKGEPSRGAYGFRIDGIEPSHLGPAGPDWPVLSVIRELGADPDPQPAGTVRVADGSVRVSLPQQGLVEILRDGLVVRVLTADPVSDEAMLHPFLALPAAFASHWLGRHSLHGGAFVHGNGAWALMAEKEGGKSTTLAGLMRRGRQILTDDVLAIDGLDLFPGPRTVDLRSEASGVLGGEEIGVVGERTRWRLKPHAAPGVLPLRGIVHLEWGDKVSLEELDPRSRLHALIRNRVLRPEPGDELRLLELAGLPALRFTRPARIAEIDAQLDQLLAALPSG